MANYIVGDIQGCYDELKKLLKKASFDAKQDTLWLAGDLVARGPKSLKTLRFVHSLGDAARCVLGNHDLHLLATSIGIQSPKDKDRTAKILAASDKEELLTWLRHQPLLVEHDEFVMCHAGISPQWDLTTARQSAREVESILQHEEWPWLLTNMYSNTPTYWQDDLYGIDRYRYIINAYTRMRFCHPDGELEMGCKLPPNCVDSHQLQPWFQLESRQPLEKTVIFGHWAALMGCYDHQANVIGLDTGCVWGEHLTMLRWEDKQFFTQRAIN